jgi:hypothetical protein
MAGTARDPNARQGEGTAPPWPAGVLPVLALYVLVQLIDGFSVGVSSGLGSAMLRGPWLAARTAPFLFLLTLNRRGDQALALAAGLAAGQIVCSAYVDAMTRAILKTPDRFAATEAILSCLSAILIAFLLWRREGVTGKSLQKFMIRGALAAAVLIVLSAGPIATVAFSVMMLAPIGLRWR